MAFSPTDLANLWAWYNGDNVTITSGSYIDSLTDLSGNSRTATILNALYKGSQVSAALNGHATIAEDGTNGSAYATAGNFPLLNATDATIYVVAKKMTGDTNYSKFVYTNSGFRIGQGVSSANVGGESGNGTPVAYATAAASDDTFYTMRLRITGGTVYFSLNNGTEATHSQGASFTAGPLTLLGDISNKQIAEVIIYTANVTGNNSNLVEYFLQQKYDHFTWTGDIPSETSTSSSMAQVNGVDVVLQLSTDGTTYKTLVCETENGIDQNTETTSVQTKCDGGAVITSPGATSWSVNASGAVNPSPDTDEVSYSDLQGYWKNKTLVYAKIDDSGAGFKHIGSGYVTKLSVKNPTNGPSTFDFTLTGTGSLTIA